MAHAQPADPPPLTAEQHAIAERLYRHLQELRRSGVRRAEVDLDDAMGVRPIGRRVDMAGLQVHPHLSR
jgi:hypothetical protein